MTQPAAKQPPRRESMERIAHANDQLRVYGESVRHFFRSQQRSTMASPMFNLPGRLILGSYCYYEQLPALLAELERMTSAHAAGQGMRRIGARPNAIHLHSLMLGYFNGREQAILRGTARPDDAEEIAHVVEFWETAARASRADAQRLPDEAGWTMPSLAAEEAEALAGQLRGIEDQEARRKLRRMMATLELYTFILNGEARVGVFHHGPYRLANGDMLVVKELTGFRDNYYPWQRSLAPLPVDGVVRARRYRGLEARIVLMGSLTTEPRDEEQAIIAERVFALEGGKLRPLQAAESVALAAQAAEAQMKLYGIMMEWDERYRVEYGAELYGNLLRIFAEPCGRQAEFGAQVRKRFRDSVARHAEDLVSGAEPPLILQHIAKTEGPIYTPIHG
ncbi:MAG: hypothetical protein LAN71_03035 [Acidobacteriia bacterium]|nr:hypothetical protein [Terriglobia bacterium]